MSPILITRCIMDILIVCLLSLALVLLIILLVLFLKKKSVTSNISNSNDIFMKLGNIETEIKKQVEDNKTIISLTTSEQYDKISKAISDELTKINNTLSITLDREISLLQTTQKSIQDNLNNLNTKVSDSIDKGFKNSNEQVQLVVKSLEELKSASLNLKDLSQDIQSLNQSLNFSRPSGKFGEQVLEAVLRSVFGDTKDIFELQYALINNNDTSKRVIADAVVHLPQPLNLLCIDSKFSYIKFKALFNNSGDNALKQEFKIALKNEINKIAASYIINDKTAPYAIMFIPNDGIFAYIEGDDDLYAQVVEYAYKKKVIITSPSTLQPILANLNLLRIKHETITNIGNVLEQIDKVKKALLNYQTSWQNISKAIDVLTEKRDDFDKKVKTLNQRLDGCLSDKNSQEIYEIKND